MNLVDALKKHGRVRRSGWMKGFYAEAKEDLLFLVSPGEVVPWEPTFSALEATDYEPYAEPVEERLSRYSSALKLIAEGDNGCGGCNMKQIARDALAGGR